MSKLKNFVQKIWCSITYNPEGLRLFFKKLRIATEIVFYIVKYYLEKGIYYLKFKMTNDIYKLELKSLLLIIIFSFLFYYFIVIELSILLFGYSLLCYWFLFIFIVVSVLLAWRLEAEFLKEEMTYDDMIPMEIWFSYYKNQTPLTFKDYLTNYKKRPLFKIAVIDRYRIDLQESRLEVLTFFLFLISVFLYFCIYWFDPRFVKFVAKYFFPVVNFFETWWNPRLEDFFSAIIWFWNRLVTYIVATKPKESTSYKIAKQIPKASTRLDDAANRQWSRKISLWKNVRFGDIYFLWALKINPALKRLVFEVEPPMINGTWFDPNWKMFFLRYITGQFDNQTNSFWTKYFTNDKTFWTLITNFWNQINTDVDRTNNQTKTNYLNTNKFANTSYEAFLSENYFDGYTINTKPLYERFGSNRDLYANFTKNYKVEKNFSSETMREIFTTTAYHSSLFTLSGLISYNKKTGNWRNLKTKLLEKLTLKTEAAKFIINNFQNIDYKDLRQFLFVNIDIPLYSFSNFENFDLMNEDSLKLFLSKPINSDQLINLFHHYNYWLGALESQVGVNERGFIFRGTDPLSLAYITTKIERWVRWLDNFCNKEGFTSFLVNQLPAFEEFKFFKWKYLKLSNFMTYEWKPLMGPLLAKQPEKPKKIFKKKPVFLVSSTHDIINFIKVESQLWTLEWQFNLRATDWTTSAANFKSLRNMEIYPWYVWTLKYFGITDTIYVLPGFIRYYTPTPYPSTFSTFGFFWLKYQFFWKNVSSTVVGQSDSLAGIKSSTPVPVYAGVEAIMYIKPFLQIFDFFVKIFIKAITYPIEFLTMQTIFPPLTTAISLAFFIHLIWFIHFYIYIFVSMYVLFYAALYYHRKVGFLWFYEWMFEETVFSLYTNKIYWHSISDIWLNYKSPEQFYNFAIHTNLLLHYTFFNYTQFFFVANKTIRSVIKLLTKISNLSRDLKDYSIFTKFINFSNATQISDKNILIFWSFYNIWVKRYTFLLFSGGSNCSIDHLIWSYLDYLSHTSNFLSRALWQNYYKLNENIELTSLIKQFTILASSTSLVTTNFFMSNPILDTNLSWKLLTTLISVLFDLLNNKQNYLFDVLQNKEVLSYISFLTYKSEFYTNFLTSGLDVFSIFENQQFYFLTKLGNFNFWDDTRYWLLAFFWSFWFVPKIWYPFLNLHLSHEVNRLQLSRVAYSNSWIGQSMYTRPYFNIVQHIWWTSKLHCRAFGLVNTSTNLNQSGLNIIDNVWNFYEKWYPHSASLKIETVFGFVRSLNLDPEYILTGYGLVPFSNKNFDLSFPDQAIDKWTTDWGYSKTNPPLNVCELGLTPTYFLKLFKNFEPNYSQIYLSFLPQLQLIDWPFKLKHRNLKKEFKSLNFYQGIRDDKEHSFYAKYEYYFKKFDFEFQYLNEFPLSNWIFSFDTSYFFSHFTTWDYFCDIKSIEWKNIFSPKNIFSDSQTLNSFLSNFDMLATLNTVDNWFKKPFGTLDKSELHSMKKFKTTKILDQNSYTWYREDPFLNLDKEHTATEVGLTLYPKNDDKNLDQAYSEDFAGYRQKRFPFNPNIVKNSVSPLVVGWVGEIYYNTNELTSFLYSLNYASAGVNVMSFNDNNYLESNILLLGGKYHKIETFFVKNSYHRELLAWAFTWVNLILHPASYWYAFGPKSLAWFDYWSWKTGFSIDYKNGLYSYWPYLGYWHSFAIKLTPYDPLYGFYQTYWQIYDNPLVMDLSTGAIDVFKPKEDEEIIQEILDAEESTDPDFFNTPADPLVVDYFSLAYRELYYSFHHPYFIGYLLFWVLVFSTSTLYLGMVNFSFKRFLLKDFLITNTTLSLSFDNLSSYWQITENWFRKQMFKYRMYYSNPIYLMSLLDCTIDDDILQPIDNNNTMHKYYLLNSNLFSFLSLCFKFTADDIIFLLDFKKIYNHSFLINWLTLDIPFPINPYIVLGNYKSLLNTTTQLDTYKIYSTSFSHYDTLRENFNFNLFFDWATGTYLDTINLVSYLGCFKGTLGLPTIFSENQSYMAGLMLRNSEDKSKELANELNLATLSYISHDLPMFSELSLHNFSLLDFFQESVEFFLSFETLFFEWKNFFNVLKFYVRTSYFHDYGKYGVSGLVEIDSKIASIALKNLSKVKQFIFIYWFFSTFSHDILINWMTTGLFFNNWFGLSIFFKSFKLRLFTRYSSLQKFYFRLGFIISRFFFKKH